MLIPRLFNCSVQCNKMPTFVPARWGFSTDVCNQHLFGWAAVTVVLGSWNKCSIFILFRAVRDRQVTTSFPETTLLTHKAGERMDRIKVRRGRKLRAVAATGGIWQWMWAAESPSAKALAGNMRLEVSPAGSQVSGLWCGRRERAKV